MNKFIIRKGTQIWRSRADDVTQEPHWDAMTAIRDVCYSESDLIPYSKQFTNTGYIEFRLPENIAGDWKRICVESKNVEEKND